MGKFALVTGSVMSGKSRWAASYFDCCDGVQYLCTAPHVDEQTLNRIVYSESSRNVKWNICCGIRLEYLDGAPGDNKYFILDGIPDIVFRETETDKVVKQLAKFIAEVKKADGCIVIVTGEADFRMKQTEENYKRLCIVNQRLSGIADEVYMTVSGNPIKIK